MSIKSKLGQLLLGAALTTVAPKVSARGGGSMDSGGADLREAVAGSAWFLGGDQPVHACLEARAAFQ